MSKILKNEDEVSSFPASALLGGLADIEGSVRQALVEKDESLKDSPELGAKLKERMAELRKAITNLSVAKQKKEGVEECQEAIRSFFNDKFLEAVDSLGVRTHADHVDVRISPGSFVFDLYVGTYKPPQAPLALALHQSKVQKMATDMEKDTIALTDDVLNVIRKPLEDERLWGATNLTGRITVNGETKYLTLNSAAVSFYPKTMDTVLRLFGEGIFDDEQNEARESS